MEICAQTYERLLARVEKPGRYLGNELGRVNKNPHAVDLRIALAFPEVYEIAQSHPGLQLLYDLLNRRDDVYAERVYAPFLDGVASREDLNRLFREMTGNLVLGHTFVSGGTQPKQDSVPVGLLGADYSVSGGRYRFDRILAGENWNPKLQAPLTQPGVNVKAIPL